MKYKLKWMDVLLNIEHRTATKICKKTDITTEHCGKLLYDMHKKNWLKQVSGKDKRARFFQLTPKGQYVFDACFIIYGNLNNLEVLNEEK